MILTNYSGSNTSGTVRMWYYFSCASNSKFQVQYVPVCTTISIVCQTWSIGVCSTTYQVLELKIGPLTTYQVFELKIGPLIGKLLVSIGTIGTLFQIQIYGMDWLIWIDYHDKRERGNLWIFITPHLFCIHHHLLDWCRNWLKGKCTFTFYHSPSIPYPSSSNL